MGPSSEMVCKGYLKIPDKGSILRAHGLDLGLSSEALEAQHPKVRSPAP